MIRPVTRRASPWTTRYRRMLEALPWLYCVWAVLTGSSVVWLMPPWQNADEGAQVERAVQIGLGHPVGERFAGGAGGLTDSGVNASNAVMQPVEGHPDTHVDAAMLASAAAGHWGHTGIEAFANTAIYPPFLYAASVPAVWIGKATRMRIVETLRLVRLFNLLAAAALGAVAIAAAQRTRLAIAAVLVLPMSLALSASASQDALLLPLAALAVALIDRARALPGAAPGWATHALVGLLLLLVLLAKPPYLPLALLLLLLPDGRPRLRLGLVLGVAALTLGWTAYAAARISVPMFHADPHAQAIYLMRHPAALFPVLGRTLATSWDSYVTSAIGVLGWLDVRLPRDFIVWAAWGVLLALLSAAAPEGVRGAWWRNRTLVGVASVLASALGVFVSIYLIWSRPGGPVVEGVQGRYFLPLLPALALAMPSLGRGAAALRPPALADVLALAAVTPAVMLTAIVSRYYLVP